VERDRLGVLGLARLTVDSGTQPLYLPALTLGRTSAVTYGRHAVFDLPLVQNSPEPEVPAVLPE